MTPPSRPRGTRRHAQREASPDAGAATMVQTLLPLDDELDVFNCPLAGVSLIEASAGTGKTWAICGLVLRLLLERGLAVQQVLVVTFTEAATAELCERVRSRLAEVLAAVQPGAPAAADAFVASLLVRLRGLGHTDDAMARRLDLALRSFDEAAIFTIHGYCQRALADAPFSARLPMAMEVLTDDSELRDAAVKDAWRAEVSRPDLPPALAGWLLRQKDQPSLWTDLLRRMASRPLASRRWPPALDGAEQLPEVDTAAVEQAYQQAARRWLNERAAIVARLQSSLHQLNGNTYRAAAILFGAAGLDRAFASGDPLMKLQDQDEKAELFGIERLRLCTKKGKTTPSHVFFDECGHWFALRREAEGALVIARKWLLRHVLDRADAALRRHKHEQGQVAFDDMLFNLHQRLHDPADAASATALAETLRARFPAALIDEFQDTDPLQFAIFRRLYRPDAGAPAKRSKPTSLFLVGDPKQAIYSFRNADLRTYLQARDIADVQYSLARNQRSTAPLIEGLNRLFTRNPDAFMQRGLNYRQVQPGTKPRAEWVDRSLPDDPARRAALQLWQLPPHGSDGRPLSRDEAQSQVLRATALEVARLLAEAGQGRLRIGGRPLRAGDVAVLVRSHRQGADVRQALADRGVRAVELSQASVYHSPEAEDLARVLSAVQHPAREGLLRAALATEAFGLDARRLDALDQPADGLPDQLSRFAERCAGYRERWQQRGIGVMLRELMRTEALATRLLQLPRGERRLTNWLHLAEALHQAEALQRTPHALWRWFERQRADETVTEASQQRLESDRNLVQIVTLHRAKGLEYPVVFCPFLWGAQRSVNLVGDLANDHAEALAGHGAESVGGSVLLDFCGGVREDAETAAIRQRIVHAEAAETLRLVYVALTRAVHRCTLVVAPAALANRAGKPLAGGNHTALNWLVAGAHITPADWLAGRPARVEAQAVEDGWHRLLQCPAAANAGADAGAVADIAPVSLCGIDEILATPASAASSLAEAPPTLRSLDPPAHLPAGWFVGSYSLLSRQHDSGTGESVAADASDQAAVDHDGQVLVQRAQTLQASEGEGDERPANALSAAAPHFDFPPDDVLRFPRGAAAGDCIHQVFERVDFREPDGWAAVIDDALRALPGSDAAQRPDLAAMLQRMLRDVCGTAIAPGLRLAELPRVRRLDELEFHVDAPALSASTLNRGLERLGYPMPRLAFGRFQGYLRGFIDLVFEHHGCTYLIDWKSNHLGRDASAFRPEACVKAMAAHGYHLQSLIYSLALDRLLRLRRADYRHEQHFGGVFYLFVRGVRPGWTTADGRPCGVHFHRPSADTLARFGGLLTGGGMGSAT